MKIVINIIAFFVFIVQFFSFAFSALNQKEPECTKELLYSCFMLFAIFCSLITIPIFAILYNCKFKLLKERIPNYIILVIVLLGSYIHISQLLSLHNFIITSCILLLFDIYIIRKVLSCIKKSFKLLY